MSYSPQGHKESDMAEVTDTFPFKGKWAFYPHGSTNIYRPYFNYIPSPGFANEGKLLTV